MHRRRFHRSSILVAAVAVAVLAIVLWRVLTPSSETPPKPSETPSPTVSATPNTKADSDVRHQRALIEAQRAESTAAPGQIPRTLEHFPFDVLLNYDRLTRQAEAGDVEAAKALYRLVLRCKHVAVDPDEVEGLIAAQKQDARDDPAEPDDGGAFLREQAHRCGLLSDEQRHSFAHWLALAAESGDAEAKLDYVTGAAPLPDHQDAAYWTALADYRKQASRYLDELIAGGYTDALSVASANYAGDGLYPPDPVKQYAYLYAFLVATGEIRRAEASILQDIGLRLTAQELEEAKREGEALLRTLPMSGSDVSVSADRREVDGDYRDAELTVDARKLMRHVLP